MRIFFTLVFLFHLLLPHVALGDSSEKADSLILTDTSTATNKAIVDSLFSKSWALLASDPEGARNMASGIPPFISPDDLTSKLRLLNLTGISYFIQANYKKATEYHMEALSLSMDNEENLMVAHAYNNLGLTNFRSGNYNDAIDFFLNAIRYYEDLGDIRNKASSNNNMGILYAGIDNFEKAHFHYDEAYKGFVIENDSIGIAALWSNRGSLFLKQEKVDSAFLFLDKAIEMEIITGNKFGLSSSYGEVAEVYFYQENYEKAHEYFSKSADIAVEVNHSYQHAVAQMGMAKTWLKLGKTRNALKNAALAMEVAEHIDTDQLRLEVHQVFSNIFEATSDYKNSLEHYRKSMTLKESLMDQSKLHQIYNQEILHLSQAKEIQKLEIQRQDLQLSRKNTVILLITVAFMFSIAGVVLLYHNYRYRQIASHQKAIADLTETKSRAAVQAELQERKRIGQELHDGLGQMLSIARLNVSVIQQKSFLSEERKAELLNAALFSVDQAFNELRDISHNLAPSVLSEKGLASALKALAEQVNQSKSIKVKLEVFGIKGLLDNLIENTLYRATQELLNNSLKHAQPTEIFIQLVKNDSDITLIVEDNGRGFNEEKTLLLPGGGLQNIRSRVENLKGSIFVDALPKRGTIVTIVIPLKINVKNVKETYTSIGN